MFSHRSHSRYDENTSQKQQSLRSGRTVISTPLSARKSKATPGSQKKSMSKNNSKIPKTTDVTRKNGLPRPKQ